jgi:nucleoside-diphosphate-sugar epimerase
MNVIAIAGASSFIGTHLLEHLSSRNDLHLKLLVHHHSEFALPGPSRVDRIRGDLLNQDSLNGFVESGCTVVNLVHLRDGSPEENFRAVGNLAEACQRVGVKRLIHCSTAVVSGRISGDRVTEATPLRPRKAYEFSKAGAERILLDRSRESLETAILRPTLVFGKKGKNLLKLAEDLLHGNMAVNYLRSCLFGRRRMNLVYIDTVVSALAFLIRTEHPVGGQIFIISEDEDPANNYQDVERFLIKRLGARAYPLPVIPWPSLILKTLLRWSGRTNTNPALIYDCEKIRSWGFRKPLAFEEGLTRFTDWYLTTEERKEREKKP